MLGGVQYYSIWAQVGMLVDNTIDANCGAHSDVATTLPWFLNDGPLADVIPASPPMFGQIEAGLINENEFVLLGSHLHIKDSLKHTWYTQLVNYWTHCAIVGSINHYMCTALTCT